MGTVLFVLFGLLLVGAAIYFGSRQPPDPNARPDDGPWNSIPTTSLPAGYCDPAGDRDGDGVPDREDDNDGVDSDGDGSDSDGGGDSSSD